MTLKNWNELHAHSILKGDVNHHVKLYLINDDGVNLPALILKLWVRLKLEE